MAKKNKNNEVKEDRSAVENIITAGLKVGGYERAYKEAEKAKKTMQLSHEFYQWEEEGQVLIGRLLSFEPTDSKLYEGKYNHYIFDTDDGLMGVICGKVVDNLVEERDLIGRILRIEYQGQRQLDAGKTVNRFRIDIIEE